MILIYRGNSFHSSSLSKSFTSQGQKMLDTHNVDPLSYVVLVVIALYNVVLVVIALYIALVYPFNTPAILSKVAVGEDVEEKPEETDVVEDDTDKPGNVEGGEDDTDEPRHLNHEMACELFHEKVCELKDNIFDSSKKVFFVYSTCKKPYLQRKVLVRKKCGEEIVVYIVMEISPYQPTNNPTVDIYLTFGNKKALTRKDLTNAGIPAEMVTDITGTADTPFMKHIKSDTGVTSVENVTKLTQELQRLHSILTKK